jgi:GNAT superfamily N-acetyltransferase
MAEHAPCILRCELRNVSLDLRTTATLLDEPPQRGSDVVLLELSRAPKKTKTLPYILRRIKRGFVVVFNRDFQEAVSSGLLTSSRSPGVDISSSRSAAMTQPSQKLDASRTWTRDGFLISTDTSLIPLEAVNRAFTSDEMYWASPLPETVMREMLEHSINFGVYSPTPSPPPASNKALEEGGSAPPDPADTIHEIAGHVRPEHSSHDQPASSQQHPSAQQLPSLIGFARLITDRVTFAWLTDVYVLPEWQAQGLGRWLITCVQKVLEDMPYLRRSACIVGHNSEKGIEFYGKLMKMVPIGDGALVLVSCSFVFVYASPLWGLKATGCEA